MGAFSLSVSRTAHPMTECEFRAAYEANNARAVQAIAGKLPAHADAEDMTQGAWAELWRAKDKGLPDNVLAWVCRVARRLWWKELHPDKNRRQRLPEFQCLEFIDFDQEIAFSTDGGVHDAGERAHLYRTIENLTTPYRRKDGVIESRPARQSMKDTLRLVAQTGNAAEAARIRGVRENGMRDTLERGIKALKAHWGIDE